MRSLSTTTRESPHVAMKTQNSQKTQKASWCSQGFRFQVFSLPHIPLVQLLSHSRLFVTLWIASSQASLSFTISWSLLKLIIHCQWYHSAITSSVVPFSSCLQSFPARGSFQMSRLFISGGQSIGASASASVLPMNIQDWFPLGLNALISL